jgi:uncharacterized protein
MIKLAAALVTACVAIADPSYSASFDCHPIGSDKCPEAVICGSAAISSLDEQLASLYESLLEKISPARQEQLKDEQRLWIRGRNVCKCNASCIESQYRERIQELTKFSDTGRLKVGYEEEPNTNTDPS